MSNDLSTPADLYELLGDSHKGYMEAAKRMKTPKLAQFLAELSTERQHMQHELGAELHQLMPDVKLDESTMKGDVHRTWMDIRKALSRVDDAAMLRECERGENYLMDRFTSALEDKDVPVELFDLLRKQKSQVSLALSNVKQLHATAVPASDTAGARPL